MAKKFWIFKENDVINSRYLIMKEIAHGGTSEVYKVQDRYDEKLYALKVMEASNNLKAFYNKETNILANLSFSGNVATIKDLGIIRNLENEYAFIVLDLYENGTVDNIPSDTKYSIMSLEEVNYYFKKILNGLSSIHYNNKQAMIHKDIKPQNILLDYEREPFISDFGISLVTSGNEKLGRPNLNDGLGTPKYMAPELILPIVDHDVDGPGYFVDIYALGIMLYKYTTGIWPYEDFLVKEDKPNAKKVELQKAQRILNLNLWMDLVKPSVYNPNISPKLENIILKALTKDFHKRYQTVEELSADLQDLIGEKTKVSRPFIGYNDRPKNLPKQLEMYPSRFSNFFKRFSFWWFTFIGIVVAILCLAFVLTLFLS